MGLAQSTGKGMSVAIMMVTCCTFVDKRRLAGSATGNGHMRTQTWSRRRDLRRTAGDPGAQRSAPAAARRSVRRAAPWPLPRSTKLAVPSPAQPLGKALAPMTGLRPGLKVPELNALFSCLLPTHGSSHGKCVETATHGMSVWLH